MAIQKYNEMIRRYASDNHIQLIDFEKALTDEDGFLKKEYSVTDGEHLDIEGYHQIGILFKDALIKILADKNKQED